MILDVFSDGAYQNSCPHTNVHVRC